MRRFLPFGRHIDFVAPLPRAACVARLRAGVVPIGKRPFEDRPRGFIIANRGLFWLRAFDLIDKQSRPKLYLRMIDDGATTRGRGRMLPGIAAPIAITVLTPMLLLWMIGLILRQPLYRVAGPAGLVIAKVLLAIAVVAIVGSIWWLLGSAQRYGRPIETFVRRTLGAPPGER